MARITLGQANAIIGAALGKGRELGLKPLGVAVHDAGGHLVAAQREDGTSNGRLQVASGKAVTALHFGIPSRRFAEMAADRPAFVASLSGLVPGGGIPAAGGVLVADAGGHVVGAVGISGDTSDNDEACAVAGIMAAGLSVGT